MKKKEININIKYPLLSEKEIKKVNNKLKKVQIENEKFNQSLKIDPISMITPMDI